ncbi:MAG: hypothetical protein EOO60_12185 [Hymenobacter sp.]|nr:MAG: hypothetical protein EOO60_12185 [Hymenobacter sp.]
MALLLPSCHKQDLAFVQAVPSPSGAFWTLQVPSGNEKIAHGYLFYRDGRCIIYYLLSKEGTWRRYRWEDDKVTNTWLVRRDTLSINGADVPLLAVKRDPIYWGDFVARDTFLSVRAK